MEVKATAMTEPRTVGRMPSQRERPALPRFTRLWSSLPTVPIVARQVPSSANIALLTYADGEKRYILAPKGLEVGTKIVSGPFFYSSPNRLMLLPSARVTTAFLKPRTTPVWRPTRFF